MNILIIEPSTIFQLALKKIFSPYAANIFISYSGAEAQKIYEAESIDLICLSFYLLDMDGIKFVADIRKSDVGQTITILMITSKESQYTTARSLRDGVTEIFRKSNLKELEQYLKTYAEYSRQQAKIKGNILLIDSDYAQVSEITDFFKKTKLNFIHFTSAEAATEIVKAAEFDLVITSVILGGSMSGMTLIRKIREINSTMYRVPILVISSTSSPWQKLELLRAGTNDYIQQPILLEELSLRIKNLLHNKELFDTVERQKDKLKELAVRDQLTGLYNRHFLVGIADKVIEESYRYLYEVSLLVIDLDHFKKVNDTYGHSTGDIVLKIVSELFLRTFRGSDIPVRIGGEEFIIILPHCSGENAIARAQSLLLEINTLNPHSIPISASIGVSQTPEHTVVSYDTLFAAADKAVYAAKKNGRNCIMSHWITSDDSRKQPPHTSADGVDTE